MLRRLGEFGQHEVQGVLPRVEPAGNDLGAPVGHGPHPIDRYGIGLSGLLLPICRQSVSR